MQAFSDDSIDMILCAIGGDDTYRLLPYLLKTTSFKRLSSQRFFLASRYNHEPSYVYKLGQDFFMGNPFSRHL